MNLRGLSCGYFSLKVFSCLRSQSGANSPQLHPTHRGTNKHPPLRKERERTRRRQRERKNEKPGERNQERPHRGRGGQAGEIFSSLFSSALFLFSLSPESRPHLFHPSVFSWGTWWKERHAVSWQEKNSSSQPSTEGQVSSCSLEMSLYVTLRPSLSPRATTTRAGVRACREGGARELSRHC